MRTKLFAVVATIALLAVAVGPGLVAAADGDGLAVTVDQSTNEEPRVTVTDNGTGVANATVTVDTTNGTYDGTGEYATGSNGTVGLPAANESVDIDVTASVDNRTAATTATLTPVTDSEENETIDENETVNDSDGDTVFGQTVAAFIDNLLEHRNASSGIGPAVSSFVTENNPGNAPDHAGQPENVTQGPPADAGPDEDSTRGPPADAGSDDDADDEAEDEEANDKESDDEEAEDDETENKGGTEADDEESEDEKAESDDEDTDDDDEDDDEDDEGAGSAGPPEDGTRGPP